MRRILFITNFTQIRSFNKLRCFDFASYSASSLSSSLGDDSKIPINYESTSSNLFTIRESNSISSSSGFKSSSLNELILDLSDVVPDITRRFRRYPVLKAENVLELLLDFESESRRGGIGGRKVRVLWEIFRWGSVQYKGFKHLHQAFEIMASVLIREGMFKELELLLMEMEKEGDMLDNEEIFCDLIKNYVNGFDSNKAVMLFDWMRRKGLVPLTSCYLSLLDHLVRVHSVESAYRICLDWVETTTESNNLNIYEIGKVIELLCLDQRVQEARGLVKKLVALDCKVNSSIYSKITLGYCEKQDFEDLLSFINEVKYVPDVVVCSRIIHVFCRRFGSEKANAYMEELEHFGFKPDEVTFGILIGWCCFEGNIKRAILYMSEITSKGLKPDRYSYNAILSGIFRKGLWQHCSHIVDEMRENGMLPSLSTFKVMLAGYCKARQFEEAKMIVKEMFRYGLIDKSRIEDPLSQAFSLVGFDPLTVKLKRDNVAGFSKAEFFDNLGNELYLDTDLDAYEQKLNMVLDKSVLPEFSLIIIRACNNGDLHTALELADEMARWGQKLSRRSFTVLIKSLCASRAHVKVSVSLLSKWPKLANQLDGETLNFLIQEYCKKGFNRQGRFLFHRMTQRNLLIDNTTYTSLITCLCKKGTDHDLLTLWNTAHKANWLPNLNNCGVLWECLIQKGLLEEALMLFELVFKYNPEACSIFFEKLTILKFSSLAYSIVKRLEENGYKIDQDVYSYLITGLCKDKDDLTAFAILDDMLNKNYTPSLESCLMLIPQLCVANKAEKASTLTDLCLKQHQSDSSSALIKGLILAGKMVDAENHLLSKGFSPDTDIYHLMFQGYCKANSLKKLQEVLGILVRKNMIFSVTSYREFVRKMCSEKQFLSAISLKELLLGGNNPQRLVIYNVLIFYLFQAKNCSLVDEILLELPKRGVLPDETTFNFLVHGYALCGDYSNSLQNLWTMISKEMKPNTRSLRIAISYLVNNGDLKKALDLSQEMESRSPYLETKIVEALISKGEISKAEEFLLNGMIPLPNSTTINYNTLIKKLSDLGSLDMAIHLLNTILKSHNIPDSLSYDSVINGFLRYNKLDKAMDFHTEMLDKGLTPSLGTWSLLVHKNCEANQVLESEKLIKSMVKLGETPSCEMFKIVIDRFRIENNTVKASEMMEMMQRFGYEPDFETHWSLISKLSSCKKKKGTSFGNGEGFLSKLLSGNGGFAWKR